MTRHDSIEPTIDDIYTEIFVTPPAKPGVAFERLAAIAMYTLEEGEVMHDARKVGHFSGTPYQLDAHHRAGDGQTEKMVEAKDFSRRNAKVGREHLQKLAGALPDLDSIDAGAFVSATGYTGPAVKYAQSAALITGGKPIDLYELSASTARDEEGFIKSVTIQFHIDAPQRHLSTFTPILTSRAQQLLRDRFLTGGATSLQLESRLEEFLDADGNAKLSLWELTSKGHGSTHQDDNCEYGCYPLPGLYVAINGVLAEICGLEYRIPHKYIQVDVTISDTRKSRMAFRDKDGNVLAILTDEYIRQFEFDANGKLTKKV